MATYSNSAREVEMPNGDVVVLHSEPTGGANTTSNIKKFKYDDNGHVTESSAANATDLNLNSYSTPTSGSTAIGTSDAVQTAIGKLDHQSQIDQSNILYAINNGATNQFFILNGYYQLSSVASVTADNGVLTFSNSATYTSNAEIAKITLKAGTYVLTNRYVKVGGSIYGDIRLMDGETNLTSGEVAEFTIGTDKTLSLMAYVYTGSLSNPVTIKPLLYEKELWDQKTDYMPPALPNYDLTRLEAEDRAGLIECVDGGAKNILAPTDLVPYGDGLTNNPNLTCTNNGDGTYTLNGSTVRNGRIIIHHGITSAVYGGKMLSGCPNINTGSEKCRLSIYTDTGASGVCHDAGQGNEIPTSFNTSHLAIYVFSGNTFNNVKFYPMICTKAAFGVSQKFVAYRGTFGNKAVGTVDMNSLTVEGNYYVSNATTTQHAPKSGYFFVDVYATENGEKIQRAWRVNEPQNVYQRQMTANTWGSWYMIRSLSFIDPTDSSAQNFSYGDTIGYVGNIPIAGITSQWVIVHTNGNMEGNRRLQIVEAANGTRKTRFYDGSSWSAWV